MSRVKNKFVIVDNKLIAGRVEFHRHLHKNPIGGGWWYFHQEKNKLILYGRSMDFGPVRKEQIDSAELGGSFRNLNPEIIFDSRDQINVMQIMIDNFGLEEGVRICTTCDYI